MLDADHRKDTIPSLSPSPLPGPVARLRRGLRQTHNWLQLARFGVVGASGYAVNLTVFAACIGPLGLSHLVAAAAAFLLAVASNFSLNRRWTFAGSRGDRHRQAVRFLCISGLAFLAALTVLDALVGLGTPALAAQAASIVCATPLNFVGNKVWTFAERQGR